jgi:large-conductance mechanosensitive channel
MDRIREVLRTEYIGAVAIGFLVVQVLGGMIGVIMRPINFYLERGSTPRSVFGRADIDVFNWGLLVGPVINILLLGMVAFLLLQWLYLKPMAYKVGAEAQDAEDDEDDKSGDTV